MPWVLQIGTCSYRAGIMLYPCNSSLTRAWFSSLSYPLSAATTDSGRILFVLVIIGLKSIVSCLVGDLLILIVHIICCSTSAPIDNFAYFLISSLLYVQYNTEKHELS